MVHDIDLDGCERPKSARPRRWRIGIRDLMIIVFAVACGLWLLLTIHGFVAEPIEVSRSYQCRNNLKTISLALHAYHERYGSFPPAFIADSTGRPIHSWRVLILPFLEQEALYDQYDFREPWDGPHNIRLLARRPQVFACPSRLPAPRDVTSYVAITGPGTMFRGARAVKVPEVTDGTNNTLMIAETANVAIPWTAPTDVDLRTMSFRLNDPDHHGISSKHPGGANFACGDGHVGFMKQTIDPKRLRELVLIADGDGDNGDPSF